MGQSSSRSRPRSSKHAVISPLPSDSAEPVGIMSDTDDVISGSDYTSNLPDECLACIFQLLSSGDRKCSSIVCRRWLRIEGQSRHRLSLNAKSELTSVIPKLFSRFDSVTKLALKCDRRSVSIGDDALILISMKCRNLTRLKLRACRAITDDGMAAFARNCNSLRKFSCGFCSFGAKGMNALLDNCEFLEELSVKRLSGVTDGVGAEPIGPGKAAGALKVICLKDLHNGQCFGPLIIGSNNLRSLKLFRCSADWDSLLVVIAYRVTGLVELHLEKLQLIRKLHIDGWKTNRISDDGLIAVATHCPNLQELVLIGVNPTRLSLEKLATHCQNLERLALCGSDTVGDAEISCIAAKCIALKKLCIKSCPVSDHGMEALAGGCPNLVKVKFKKCKGVTSEGADWLRASRGSLAVNLDAMAPEIQDGSARELEASDIGIPQTDDQTRGINSWRPMSFKVRLGLLKGRGLVASTLRRWSSFGGSSRNNLERS
ncbi:F-box protein At1g47056-like isoform X2 [Olea europaea var. sylvestris]|uniref:F-box protein At1g47056-like isoform X2 n=1 Tax=Olea europaea var. sylvestris TaxID=158386 RepID=UPI000C1D862B|nr:F-box protein At1g47056-like isoform X2 [Olea europaea var. sylvestris]